MLSVSIASVLEMLIAAAVVIYCIGLLKLWRRAGWSHGLRAWRAACFLGGMVLLAYAVGGPLDALADRSFAAHMLQHLLLMKAIPPLLLLGEFSGIFLQAAGGESAHRIGLAWRKATWLRSAWSKLASPWFAWSFFALSMWGWHAPAFYQAALGSEWLHAAEHLMFFGSSLLFWWYILSSRPDRTTRYGIVVLMLFTTLLHESALGALLTFTARNWYPFYSRLDPWGLTPLADQQLAGMIMWIPGGVLFGFLIEYYFGGWLKAIEKRMRTVHPEYSPIGDDHE